MGRMGVRAGGMTNLQEAIKDLKASISSDGFDEDLISEIASDWDLNPVLLARKFEESTGCTPGVWTPPRAAPERNLESLRPAAEKWYAEQFIGTGSEIGATFERGDRRGFIVAITSNKVFYIDALNEERRVLTFRNSAHRASWEETLKGLK